MTATTADGWTDFNDISSSGDVTVLRQHCNRTPRVGEPFSLGDGEGNFCQGTVIYVGESTARVRLELSTFRSLDHPTFVGPGEGNRRLAELMSDPTIAAEVRRIEDERRGEVTE